MEKEMNCCVLTYDIPHRKTYDVLCLLKAKGYRNITVIAQPLHYTKKFIPLISHRPTILEDIPLKELCKSLNYEYTIEFPQNRTGEVVLLCGAALLAPEFVNSHYVINAHPGYLPNVRGLDAFKWAIYEGQPIGVTTHVLGKEVDAGAIIERKLVPIYYNDTFHAVAQRQYEMEITMLVDVLTQPIGVTTVMEPEGYTLHKRMPHAYEMLLMQKFERTKEKYAVLP